MVDDGLLGPFEELVFGPADDSREDGGERREEGREENGAESEAGKEPDLVAGGVGDGTEAGHQNGGSLLLGQH